MLGVFLFAFFWFILWVAVGQVGASVMGVMEQYSGSETFQAYEYAATFMVNFWQFLLGVIVFVLILWLIVYCQRKSVEVMYA